MIELSCKLLLPRPFKSKAEGQGFLELFLRHLPTHMPSKYGPHEPLRKKFVAEDIGGVLEDWGGFCFIAERRKPRLLLDVVFGMESVPIPEHARIYLHNFEASGWTQVCSFRSFVIDAAETFGADLAIGHIHTRGELSERIEHLKTLPGSNPGYMERKAEREGVGTTLHGMTVGQFKTERLKLNLPDLPWLTIFGSPYVEMFGRERIEATPAHEVRTLSDGSILVNVTRDIPDTPEGWANFKTARDACKRHLNCNAFFDPSSPPGHIYRVPDFRFPLEMYSARTLA
jgi:hypothetical protein